jgi:hypothetical protein
MGMTATIERRVNTASLVSPVLQSRGSTSDLRPIAVALEVQSSAALLSVLTTIARLGCRTTHVYATERQAALGVLAPRRVAHRVLPCLRELIEVVAVVEVPDALSTPTDGGGLSPESPGPWPGL